MAAQKNHKIGLNKVWTIIEKIIAILLVIAGIFLLYNEVSVIADVLNSGYIITGKATYLQLLQVHFLPVVLSIVSLFGGCMLFFNDKTGWILSVIATAMFGFLFFISSRSNASDTKLAFATFYKSYGLTAILFFVFFILLLLRPFREKYQPGVKNWIWLTAILLLLIITKMIF
ncbi:hypothetical protein BH10BAC2_BH10BAC2_19070 [soil metagenome]